VESIYAPCGSLANDNYSFVALETRISPVAPDLSPFFSFLSGFSLRAATFMFRDRSECPDDCPFLKRSEALANCQSIRCSMDHFSTRACFRRRRDAKKRSCPSFPAREICNLPIDGSLTSFCSTISAYE